MDHAPNLTCMTRLASLTNTTRREPPRKFISPTRYINGFDRGFFLYCLTACARRRTKGSARHEFPNAENFPIASRFPVCFGSGIDRTRLSRTNCIRTSALRSSLVPHIESLLSACLYAGFESRLDSRLRNALSALVTASNNAKIAEQRKAIARI